MKPVPLISIQDFMRACAVKSFFPCIVWAPSGILLLVQTRKVTVKKNKPSYPNDRSIRYTKGNTFFETAEQVTISLQEIGDKDMVYDEKGNFVSTRPNTDKEHKGQIFIRKRTYRELGTLAQADASEKDFEYIKIQDITLPAEVYSKIFTHVLSLMKDVDLSKMHNKEVSVAVYRKNNKEFYNDAFRRQRPYAIQSYMSNGAINVTANMDFNKDNLLTTIWNIQNMLGAHEFIGHGIYKWGDESYSHHLNYLYQMGHSTWKNATKDFKDFHENNLNNYYERYRTNEYESIKFKSNYSKDYFDIYRSKGLYPSSPFRSEQDSINFNKRVSEKLQRFNPLNK